MYTRKKVDANQKEIADFLTKCGAKVVDLAPMGQGCPDLLVGFRGWTILIEVKNPEGRNRLTPRQEVWIDEWKGDTVAIVRTIEDAERVLKRYARAQFPLEAFSVLGES